MMTSLPQPARMREVIDENASIKTFVLEAKIEAEPAQFIMVWLPLLDEKPFSLVDSNPLTITVAKVGPFTAAMHELGVGDRLWFRGPLGRGFTLQGRELLMVGGGYGVAPLAFLAKRAVEAGCAVKVVIGGRCKKDLIFEERFRTLGASVVLATEDGSAGVRGLATDVAEDLLARDRIDAVYACGPEGMLERLADICHRRQVPCQLSWEAYMRCGLGLCGSCEREGLLVCRDGPVFELPPWPHTGLRR